MHSPSTRSFAPWVLPHGDALTGAGTPGAGPPYRDHARVVASFIGNELIFKSSSPLAGRNPGGTFLAPSLAMATAAPVAEIVLSSSSTVAPSAGSAGLLETASVSLAGIPLTPIGIIEAVFSPPIIFVIIGVLALCCCGGLMYAFREGLEPYMLALLDMLAAIGRTIVAFFRALYWAAQRIVYPLKECCVESFRSTDHYFNPYKKKDPVRENVPTFAV